MKDIRNDGKMDITFNNKMILPPNFDEIVKQDRLRLLTETDSDRPPLIEILSKPGEDSDAGNLDLDWEIITVTETSIDFKIIYKDPLEVS